jgi:PAS domain S-box-containing protein
VLGLLKVNGDFLGEDDLPAMDSFAGQIAAGLRNIQLMQKLQNELTARKQVEESLKRSRNLLLALSRAAQAVLSARTADEIYQAVGEQIKCLGHHVVILTASDKNQYLSHTYSTFPQELIETGEKLTGLTLQDYRFHVTPESTYWHALETGIGSFLQQTTESIAEVLPKSMRSMAIILANLLKIEQSVIAPLSVGGKIFGTLTVAGSLITEDDIPAIESFAAQVAISLNNARLSQQAEQELSERKQAETRFKALIENATDGIALMGLDGKTQYVSPSATNMFDDEADNPLEFIHPDDLHIVLNAMNDLIQNPAHIQTIECRYRHKDNFYHWVEGTYSNLLAEPSVQAVVINYRDITKRKRVEEALEQRESHYRLLADHMTDTIWLLDMNLKTTYISPSVGKVRGYTLDQLHELPLDQNLTPASLQLAMELLAVELPKILADPNYLPVHTLELEFYNCDGTVYSTESKPVIPVMS